MSIEGMKIPGVSGNAPTGRNVGHAVSSQGHAGDANSRKLAAEGSARAAAPAKQQRNAQRRLEEENNRAAWLRLSNDGQSRYSTGKATPAGQIPGGPNKLQQAQAAYAAANYSNLNPKQFASPSQSVKGALLKLRMMKRLRGK